MAFSYGFFNSKGLDRTYTAENFCDYLGSIICNGILDTYGQKFSLRVGTGLSVIIGTGKAWINGHYFINDAAYTIDLSSYQDESLSRYVAIAIVLNTAENARNISIEVTPGAPAEAPIMPTYAADANKTRLVMYGVRLNAGATSLASSNISDYRSNESRCGYCRCILGNCHVSEMLYEMELIKQEMSGLRDGTLTEKTNLLENYILNTAPTIRFTKDDDGRLFYYDQYGEMLTGEQTIKGIPYLFGVNGVLKTGWRTVAGKRYYYDQNNGKIQLGWVDYCGAMYYITLLEGKLVSQYRTIDGTRYWFDSYGVATPMSAHYPDADGDGSVTAADATLTLRFSTLCAAGTYTNDEEGWCKFLQDEGIVTGGASGD